MATQDTTEDDAKTTTEDDEVETSKGEDDSSTEDDDKAEDDETEDSDEEESDEDEDDSETEEDEDKFEKRFTQFKGESIEEYKTQLEKAHGEALSLNTKLRQKEKDQQGKLDAIAAAVAKDPEFAKKLDKLMDGTSEEVVTDPALLKARNDMEAQMDKEFKEFVEEHPEMESDPQLAEEVLEVLSDFGKQARKKGKIMGMKEALSKAWTFLGKEDDTEKVAIKAKETAAKSKTGSSVKKSGKKQEFTEEQIRVAKKWGLSPDQLAASTKSSKK